jgi:hypothetical protein
MKYFLPVFLAAMAAGCQSQPPPLLITPPESTDVGIVQASATTIRTATTQISAHSDSVGQALVTVVVTPSTDAISAAAGRIQSKSQQNEKDQQARDAAAAKALAKQKSDDDATIADLRNTRTVWLMLAMGILAVVGLCAVAAGEGFSAYTSAKLDKGIIKFGIYLLVGSIVTLICLMVIGQLIPWLVKIAVVSVAFGVVLLMIMAVKTMIANHWKFTTTVQSVDAGLATLAPDVAATAKTAMAAVQGPEVTAAVSAAKMENKAALPASITISPPPTPATGATT